MFDDNDNRKDDRGQKKPQQGGNGGGGGFNMPPFTWIAWIVIIGAFVALMLMHNRLAQPSGVTLSEGDFLQKFDSNEVTQATIALSPTVSGGASMVVTISGQYQEMKDGKPVMDANGKPVEQDFTVPDVILTPAMGDKLFPSKNIHVNIPNPMLSDIGYQLLFFVGIGVLFWFFFIRQIKIAGKGALSFGRSKARLLAKDRNKTTFKNVAGIDEAIEEVSELVEFLKDPKKFQKLGGRIPKGVLMVGPPGTG